LKTGLGILSDEIDAAVRDSRGISGSTAFLLHDTYGFPLEVTEEIVSERNVAIDVEGFEAEMTLQRERAKAARRGATTGPERMDHYRDVLETNGLTEFRGYDEDVSRARVVAVIDGEDDTFEVFLDRTPFYAESGGQVGDTGTITGPDGTLLVIDTTFALPGLRRHLCRSLGGEVSVGQEVEASIDVSRRTAIRRHHTATHVLHWALREVLGDHVKQAGSLVDDDRLRFDFSHYAAVTDDELRSIENLANDLTLRNTAVRSEEMDKEAAVERGAIAFFGDKYGDRVRVLSAGPSVEFCGGTHVSATGDIGIIKIVSESSIGANLRRIEAVAGLRTLELTRRLEGALGATARLVGASVDDVLIGVTKKVDEIKSLSDENKVLRGRLAANRAGELVSDAVKGVVVSRVDDMSTSELRDLAVAIRQQPSVVAVVLGGIAPSGGVALVAAVNPTFGVPAAELIREAAKAVGGGGGGKGDVVTAGGKNPDGIDRALSLAREAAGL
jgi:alanyl-tRNA synthetase